MTVIAWDGRSLAGDKLTNFGGLHATTTKVHQIQDYVVGCAGNTAQIAEMLNWLERGADADKFPEPQRDAKECVTMLVVYADGSVWHYENTPHPIAIENKFWAIGSGRDFAMAAMFMGKDAEQAAMIACSLDANCGNGVDVITLRSES